MTEPHNNKIARHPGKPTRVLLLDDDKFMLEVVGDMLRELGIPEVATATDGSLGLASYERASLKPDLIVCDLYMPQHDGFQFMAAMAERGYAGGVILISGQEAHTLRSATLMAQFHELNILATLEKPVSRSTLAEAIAKLG